MSRTPYRQGTVLYLKYKLEIADKEKEFNMAAMVLSSEQIPNRADEYQNRVKFFKYEYHNTGRYHQVHF